MTQQTNHCFHQQSLVALKSVKRLGIAAYQGEKMKAVCKEHATHKTKAHYYLLNKKELKNSNFILYCERECTLYYIYIYNIIILNNSILLYYII